jgi:hypothetical protein
MNFLNSVNHVNPVYGTLRVKVGEAWHESNGPLPQAALTWFELQRF